ncbi:hypothetical protein ABEB36_006225 [Hypothenemus hampei]|uniref:CWF19-like protein 1 n=1 Tax=Hypothenemus hampei TaxID=57062 RepID=A0ABD1EQ72_HYPHA
MSEKIKILFCGDVEGRFDVLFKRVAAINNKSGPFDLLLCVGNFFGINNKEFRPYRLGDKTVPVPTYILGPNKQDQLKEYPEDESQFELCPNVYYLGKRGIYNDSKGLRIAYISGTASLEQLGQPWTYNERDVSNLCDAALKGNPSFRGVDILLTSQWPAGIVNNDSKVNLTLNCTSELVSYLCMKLKPRYMISGFEGVHYEMAPFRCPNLGDHDTTMDIATRFIGLARVGNASKDKWIYALNVTPLDKMKISEVVQRTTDEISCPFNFIELEQKLFKGEKRKTEGTTQYFYDMNAPMEERKRGKTKKPRIEFDQSKCWFCLSSPSVEKHLVITVGNFCYLSLAKGGIVDEHLMICPMEHYQSTIACTEEIVQEMNSFKEALKKFYARDGRVPIFFERNYKTSHMQLQAIPVPLKATKELKDIFLDEAKARGFHLESLEDHHRLQQVIPPKTPFFTVELLGKWSLYTKIEGRSMNFPLSFAREVLAMGPVLNLPDRVEYKDCILLDKEEEISLVARIRKDFQAYDFTT